jgi:transcriptional regulator GlxA family with amidase domain
MARKEPAGSRKTYRRPDSAPREVQSSEPRVLDVTVVLVDGGYLSTAIGPIEVFHSAGFLWNWLKGEEPKPRFRVRIASVDGKSIGGPYPLRVLPECSIKDIRKTDIVVVSASSRDLDGILEGNRPLVEWLRRQHARGAHIASICSGVVFTAEAGLLEGREATTHWGACDVIRQRYPNVLWRPERFVVEDGRVFSSGGVYAATDLALYLVEKFCGHEIALQTAKSLLLSMPRTRQSGYSVLPLSRPHGDEKIRNAEDYMQKRFASDVSIDALASRAGMSPRNFIRRFKTATGRLPGAYLQALRIAVAKELLEQGRVPIQAVCTKVGYADAAFFRALFRRHTGMSPAEYRNNFAGMDFEREEIAS